MLYRTAAESFATGLISKFGDAIHAIVLFGSVARKQARIDSDIDVLVVGISREVQDCVIDFAYDTMEAARFDVFISVVYFSRDKFFELANGGNPLISTLVEQGRVLYDDGTFARLHGTAVAASRRGAERRKVSVAG
ncbi:MAG: nucleotidyltransferase domain-containing protein [Dehalococcoidia bacterium]|nr:nucleotidyltransferase domain-containing protein [Dehalococcoidia bacterium]